MSSDQSSHTVLKLAMKFALNVALVWAMSTYLDTYFDLSGGIPALFIVGALVTLLNIFVRPILMIITLPLRLLATILAVIIVNGAIVYLIHLTTLQLDPSFVRLEIFGGIIGWIVVAICFGLANWLMKEMFK